jgi:hypothetical protein
VPYHLDLKKYPKNISNNNVNFQKVGDDFNYENKLHEPKELYWNVHHINIEV